MPCTANCSGRGACHAGACYCFDGWAGASCAVPPLVTLAELFGKSPFFASSDEALAFAQTHTFQVFFRMTFATVALALLHALLVFPALLAWFGPSEKEE